MNYLGALIFFGLAFGCGILALQDGFGLQLVSLKAYVGWSVGTALLTVMGQLATKQ